MPASKTPTRDPASVTLPRVAKGKRPYFFEDHNIDQLMTFVLELMTEVMVLRDRVDTHERLLDEKATLSRADIEAYRPDDTVEAERNAERNRFVQQVLRLHVPEGRQDG